MSPQPKESTNPKTKTGIETERRSLPRKMIVKEVPIDVSEDQIKRKARLVLSCGTIKQSCVVESLDTVTNLLLFLYSKEMLMTIATTYIVVICQHVS